MESNNSNDNNSNDNNSNNNNGSAKDEKLRMAGPPPSQEDEDTRDGSAGSCCSSLQPGAVRVTGVNGVPSSVSPRIMSTTASGQEPPTMTSPLLHGADAIITLEAATVVEERELAIEYCEDKLREIEEREARLREIEARMTVIPPPPPLQNQQNNIDATSTSGATRTDAMASASAYTADAAATSSAATPSTDAVVNPTASMPYTDAVVSPAPSIPVVVPAQVVVDDGTNNAGTSNGLAGSITPATAPPAFASTSPRTGHRKSVISSGKSILSRVAHAVIGHGGAHRSNIIWCWKETASQMPKHKVDAIVGNPSDCWIRYTDQVNQALESAFRSQGGVGEYHCQPEYMVNFTHMQQTNLTTHYQREIRRVAVAVDDATSVVTLMDSLAIQPAKQTAIVDTTDVSIVWCWQETRSQMRKHHPSAIFSREHCWIRYDDKATRLLEEAYKKGDSECSPVVGYKVDLTAMLQENLVTNYHRQVLRFET